MKLAGLLSILTGALLLGGAGHLASIVSLVRHALRVFGA